MKMSLINFRNRKLDFVFKTKKCRVFNNITIKPMKIKPYYDKYKNNITTKHVFNST